MYLSLKKLRYIEELRKLYNINCPKPKRLAATLLIVNKVVDQIKGEKT